MKTYKQFYPLTYYIKDKKSKYHIQTSIQSLYLVLCSRTLAVITALSFAKYDVLN